jgi:hypothetical protein
MNTCSKSGIDLPLDSRYGGLSPQPGKLDTPISLHIGV